MTNDLAEDNLNVLHRDAALVNFTLHAVSR